jgi:hypothetical protein
MIRRELGIGSAVVFVLNRAEGSQTTGLAPQTGKASPK